MEAVEAVSVSLAHDPLHLDIETEVRRRLVPGVNLEILCDRVDALPEYLKQPRICGLRRQYPTRQQHDALRALRAAVEMRDALAELGIGGRIGVMTGEVVTGTEERLATGDAVNVAARLEQAAQPGEVLVGQPTLALVEGAVEVEPVEPLV